MRILRSKCLWLLIAVAYTAISLRYFRDRPPQVPHARLTPRRVNEVEVPLDQEIVDPTQSDGGKLFTFKIPIKRETLEGTAGLGLSVIPSAIVKDCTVQVTAECDHHYRYAHDYVFPSLDQGGMHGFVPFRDANGYWEPLGHDGVWTPWNLIGLRGLEVKVFAREPILAGLRLTYGWQAADPDAPITLAWAQPLADPVPLGERFELAFDLANWRGNPFDPGDLSVSLEVIPPTEDPKTAVAFLYQNFAVLVSDSGETVVPKGPKQWRARYRPFTEGSHRYRLHVQQKQGPSTLLAEGQFTVTPGTPPDFLRISKKNPRYFEHADGRFFYPIGWALAYFADDPYGVRYVPYLPTGNSLTIKRKMLDDLADSGGNFIRFWMADWSTGIEWREEMDNYGGIGRYNLKNAWLIDKILEHCEKRGIYAIFETLNHVRLSGGYSWGDHPYARRNGGFLRDPGEYWRHPQVPRLSNNRLRYIVGRYADSTAVHSMNYMSEVDLVGGAWGQGAALVVSSLRYMQQLDPYDHIVSNHVCMHMSGRSLYPRPEIEFIHTNAYPALYGLSEDQAFAIRDFSQAFARHPKPVIIGEYAGSWQADTAYKMRRDTLTGLWAGVASRLSGTPLSWWWNFNYGEELGCLYRHVADFMAGEDLIREDTPEKGQWENRRVQVRSAADNAEALMVGNRTKRFLFVFNHDTLCRTRMMPTTCSETEVTFYEMDAGTYVAEYWDLREGKTTVRQRLLVDGDQGVLRPPDFQEGWAVKVYTVEGEVAETGPVPREQHGRSATSSPSTSGLARWQWRITPLLSLQYEAAAERTVNEAFVGLPSECRGAFPILADAKGAPVEFAWRFLGDADGWQIRIPVTAQGPFTLTCSATQQVAPGPFDEDAIGLELAVIQNWRRQLSPGREAWFEDIFQRVGAQQTVRVNRIDLLENPVGGNDYYLSHYSGPLFVPRDGQYKLGTNSDDGSFVKLDGRVVVSWLGNHNPETVSPARSGGSFFPCGPGWSRNAAFTLTKGIHWIEYYHQEMTGSQMAYLGWLPPLPAAEPPAHDCFFQTFEPGKPEWDIVPARFLSGKVPCSIEALRDGERLGTLIPTAGLHLRRPGTDIFTARVSVGASDQIRDLFFAEPGLHEVDAPGGVMPVWVHNQHMRDFSLEWLQNDAPGGKQLLRTLLYDIDLPLVVEIGAESLGARLHRQDEWECWPLAPDHAGKPYAVLLGGVKLAGGTIQEWPSGGDAAVEFPRRVRVTRLVQPAPVPRPSVLPTWACQGWYYGPASEGGVVPEGVRFDLWTRSSRDLVELVRGGAGEQTGVLIVLDRTPVRTGLSTEDVRVRTRAHMRALLAADIVPILALGPDLDFAAPLDRRYAETFVRLAETFRFPCLNLQAMRQ